MYDNQPIIITLQYKDIIISLKNCDNNHNVILKLDVKIQEDYNYHYN